MNARTGKFFFFLAWMHPKTNWHLQLKSKKVNYPTLRFQLETTILGGWNPAGMTGCWLLFTPSASSRRIPWKSDTKARLVWDDLSMKKLVKKTKVVGHTALSRMMSFESTTKSNLSSSPVSLFRSLMWDLQPWSCIIWLMLTHRDTVKRLHFSYWETTSGRLLSKPTLLSWLKIRQTCFQANKICLTLTHIEMGCDVLVQ